MKTKPGSESQPEGCGMHETLASIGASEVLNNIPDGAYITDVHRRILYWSQAAERITGWKAAEVVGHRCSENILIHVDKDGHQLCKEDTCPLHRAMVTGETSRGPVLVFAQHKDGSRVPVEVTVAPLRNHSGHVVGGIELFRDAAPAIQDLRRAKSIQEQVLKSELGLGEQLSVDVRYRPEELVGGDFYRVQKVSEGVYAVMIADVMGHGVASALYTMHLRAMWEECQDLLHSPAEFMAGINRRLHRLAQPNGYFATAALAVLDLNQMELEYVRAGHPPPFLLPAKGAPRLLEERSPAVGLLEEARFRVAKEVLNAGDRLLLYTDGAVEICNAAGEELEPAGLLRRVEQLPPGRLDLDQIEQMLLAYSNNIRLPDDLTLISLYVPPLRVTG